MRHSLKARSVQLANRGVFAHAAREVVLVLGSDGAPAVVVNPAGASAVSFPLSEHVRTESQFHCLLYTSPSPRD